MESRVSQSTFVTKRKTIGITILLLFTAATGVYVFGVLGWDGLTTRAKRQLWRERVRAVFREIELGLTQQQVLEIAPKHGWMHPRSNIVSDAEIRLGTPIEFGASNWILILTFSDGKLVSARVRTEDNINRKYKPVGAPEDIVDSDVLTNERNY